MQIFFFLCKVPELQPPAWGTPASYFLHHSAISDGAKDATLSKAVFQLDW